MNILKFMILWLVVTVAMTISWSIGSLVGNSLTSSVPPALEDASGVASLFLSVCVVNSLLISMFLWSVRSYSGRVKLFSVMLYLFVLQCLLPQMETIFFSESIHISGRQIFSILIAGFVMSSVVVSVGILVTNRMTREGTTPFNIPTIHFNRLIFPVAVLIVVVYPLLYMVFGHYVAWQNETLRIFYSQSAELRPFSSQFGDAFINGIYFFQVLRALIWVAISVPVVLMLQHAKGLQYILIALLSALPATQLFIPNPFMPSEIAMTHFVETSISNIIWGMAITFVINKFITKSPAQHLMVNHRSANL